MTRAQLQQQMEWVLAQGKDDAVTPPSPPHGVSDVCMLSTLERDEWAEKREQLISSSEYVVGVFG